MWEMSLDCKARGGGLRAKVHRILESGRIGGFEWGRDDSYGEN